MVSRTRNKKQRLIVAVLLNLNVVNTYACFRVHAGTAVLWNEALRENNRTPSR
jgi:hypothetical protein